MRGRFSPQFARGQVEGRRRPAALIAAVVGVLVAGGIALAAPASALPTTPSTFPAGAAATKYVGPAFDIGDAPTIATLTTWRASPYRAIATYISGSERTYAQANLTATWVTQATALGWTFIPVHLGAQPFCTTRPPRPGRTTVVTYTADTAVASGRSEALAAVAAARALGMLPGSAIYGDVEYYDATKAGCGTAVARWVSSWTSTLRANGYLAGIYAQLSTGATLLSGTYSSTAYARPDALWLARWDGVASLKGWAGIPDTQWATHQRAKQYRGDHAETWGGLTLNIDSDLVDAPVATVAWQYRTTSTTSLNVRSAPNASAPVVRTVAAGAVVRVVCQLAGSKVGTTSVWNRLAEGGYVTDYYVSTPGSTGYTSTLPRCTLPFQVSATTALNVRTSPSASSTAAYRLQPGALAWVACQGPGTKVGTTSVWDRLEDGRWTTDYYVATPSKTTYSAPLPRC